MLESPKPVQDLSEALTFDRDVTFSLRKRKSFTQTAFGVEWPCNVGKKSISDGVECWKYFFVACACALAGTNGTKRWPTHFIVIQIFNRQHEER